MMSWPDGTITLLDAMSEAISPIPQPGPSKGRSIFGISALYTKA